MNVARIQSIHGGEKVLIARQTLLFIHDLTAFAACLSAKDVVEKVHLAGVAAKKIKTNLELFDMQELIEITDRFLALSNKEEKTSFLHKKQEELHQKINDGISELVTFTNSLR